MKNRIKRVILSFLVAVFFNPVLYSQLNSEADQKRIISWIDSTRSPELVLIQEFIVDAPIDAVWNAYTTKEGWEGWAVPMAQVDLKVGGKIQTNYNKDGFIGDSTTIVTHIVNYVPQKLITLQAEITDNFPEFMKKEADNFYNIMYFTQLDNGKVKVQSFGIGYKNTPKYLQLMNFFIPANEKTMMNLITYLEKE